MNRCKFYYDGPVYSFGKLINPRWRGSTTAPTEAKAKSNLAFQYKKSNGYEARTAISLPGEVVMKGE